jgi:plastocyanin
MRKIMTVRFILLIAGTAFYSVFVPARAATVQIVVRDMSIVPVDVSARVGDTIEWLNKDVFVHSATAKNGDWDVTLPPNKTERIILKKAGRFDYYCRFHPNMTAILSVAP